MEINHSDLCHHRVLPRSSNTISDLYLSELTLRGGNCNGLLTPSVMDNDVAYRWIFIVCEVLSVLTRLEIEDLKVSSHLVNAVARWLENE